MLEALKVTDLIPLARKTYWRRFGKIQEQQQSFIIKAMYGKATNINHTLSRGFYTFSTQRQTVLVNQEVP